MSLKKKNRHQKGFTLVEVIVVAVIVAVLAGVSVPLYLGYINSSRENAAANAAGSAASFAGACINGGRAFSLAAADAAVTGMDDGSVALTCQDDGNTIASLVVPSGITLTNSMGNSITGQHAEGGNVSQPYVFTTAPAPDGP